MRNYFGMTVQDEEGRDLGEYGEDDTAERLGEDEVTGDFDNDGYTAILGNDGPEDNPEDTDFDDNCNADEDDQENSEFGDDAG